ncbi:MAG: hypothetical protein ACRD2J_10575 [Thermoanaerobaculia bacterium]
MTDTSPVDDLRARLRELGYLSHGLERWFALDPWSSRTFWQELLAVAAKAATVVAPFVALPMMAVMILRNHPLPVREAAVLTAGYLLVAFVGVVVLMAVTALALKLRPSAVVERPRLLTGIALALAAVVAAAIAGWWGGFADAAEPFEAVAVSALALLLVAVSTVVFSAALLSFSIHETRRIPAVARGSRALPIVLTGAAMILVLLAATRAGEAAPVVERPNQIATVPRDARVAFLAVDGLTGDLYAAHEELSAAFSRAAALSFPDAASAAERWASVGTGTARERHRVRAIEGLRIAGSERILQAVSRFDPFGSGLALGAGLARRQALPAAVRERDYVWEILASRGIPVAAVNWWVGGSGATEVSQREIFGAVSATAPARSALEIDRAAGAAALRALAGEPRFVTVYLPALDIVLNRLEVADARRVALAVEAVDALAALVRELRAAGFEILLVGAPGEDRGGPGIAATTLPLDLGGAVAMDLAPTLLDLFGFPASREMPGESLVPESRQGRIASFGSRTVEGEGGVAPDEEYYEALRSLGYVQ